MRRLTLMILLGFLVGCGESDADSPLRVVTTENQRNISYVFFPSPPVVGQNEATFFLDESISFNGLDFEIEPYFPDGDRGSMSVPRVQLDEERLAVDVFHIDFDTAGTWELRIRLSWPRNHDAAVARVRVE